MFSDTVDVDTAVLSKDPYYESGAYIVGYDLTGRLTGCSALFPGEDNEENGVACDASGNVFIAGDYWGVNLPIGPDILTQDRLKENYFLGKYGASDTTFTRTDTAICAGRGIISAPAGYNTYLWDDGQTAQARMIDSAGTYLLQTAGCGHVLIDTFHIAALPVPGPITGPDTVCLGHSIVLADTAHRGTWSSSNTAKATVTAAAGTVTGSSPGSSTITYTLANGCFITKTVTVKNAPCVTSVNEVATAGGVKLYPVPATDRLNISMDERSFTSVKITNVQGQVLVQKSIVSPFTTVDIKRLPPGLYYAVLIDPSGERLTKKFVKE
jgi:hypothetical protein